MHVSVHVSWKVIVFLGNYKNVPKVNLVVCFQIELMAISNKSPHTANYINHMNKQYAVRLNANEDFSEHSEANPNSAG